MYDEIIKFIRNLYDGQELVPLHAPVMGQLEKKYLSDCVDSTFVSSVGKYVGEFEELISNFTKAKYAIATTNGTSALHMAMILSDVRHGDEVITQALTFVATANAISHLGAHPIFIDSEIETYGLCPIKLEEFLAENCTLTTDGKCLNMKSKRIIKACVPMHVFGRPVKIKKIKEVCDKFNIRLIEDAAESLGSYVDDQHTGLVGAVSAISFNGNKTITCGGGGIILTNNEVIAKRAKHLTTTAKINHPYEFKHDEVGYNYRLPNLNAAFACAQMHRLEEILKNKRETAEIYNDFFGKMGIRFSLETPGTKANYWLNSILLEGKKERDSFLEKTNKNGIMTRPIWTLMNKLEMYKNCQTSNLDVAEYLEERIVNIPSSYRGKAD